MCKNGHFGLHIILINCIFYAKMINYNLFTIVFNYKMGLLPRILQKILDKASLAISSLLRPRMRPIPKSVFGTWKIYPHDGASNAQ